MKSHEILEHLSDVNPEAILWDGFDDAVVGIGQRCGMSPVAIYDRGKCIEVLMRDLASHEDAEEYFSYNVDGCYAGEHTPIIGVFSLEGETT